MSDEDLVAYLAARTATSTPPTAPSSTSCAPCSPTPRCGREPGATSKIAWSPRSARPG